jgi:hypothetical protein
MVSHANYVCGVRICAVRAGSMLIPPEVGPARCILDSKIASHGYATNREERWFRFSPITEL